MNEEQDFLASAYLDGELTDEERRLAEADPAVMAEVEQLRALQGELAAPPPPSEAARESAIGAAMAQFGQLYGSPGAAPAAASASTEPVVPFRPRPAMGRWLSIAAAVVVIGLLGVVVATGLGSGGDDDDSSASDEPAAEAMTEEPAEEPADEPASDDAGNDRITEQAPTAVADADTADDGADDAEAGFAEEPATEAAEEEMAADEPAEEPAEEPADDMAADEMEDPADEEPVVAPADPADILDADVPITTEEELAAVGQLLLDRLADEGLTTPEEACPYPNMLARATLLDSLTGELVPVVIDVDLDGNLVLAIDVDSCEVRLDAALSEAP